MRKIRRKMRNNPLLSTGRVPFAYAEAYKTLRTNLNFVSANKECKSLIITSAVPNEGKSTVAVNLAMTLAESHARILLVECDLRNPTLRQLLRVSPEYKVGLTSLLVGESAWSESVFRHPRIKCDVLLAGVTPPNPTELLSSFRMKELLDHLKKQYDFIICDTPPVGVVTDAVALSRYCDGVILVVRQKAAAREQVRIAKRNLDAVNANILGTILSCYDMSGDT